MATKLKLLFFTLITVTHFHTYAQCPPDIDFETGLSSWQFYRGTVAAGPVYSLTPTVAVTGLHTQTSGSGTDMYGGFPVVSPGGGLHSLKLGHDSANSCAERASYFVHVPATGTYSLVYRYAAVLQDGFHAPSDQPRFVVNASDSATGAPVACINYNYVASGSIPSFLSSSVSSTVYYKTWTTGNMKFYGWGGHTIRIDFTAAACSHGDHWGYGYLDMNCNLFTSSIYSCMGGTTTLSAPDGYQSYAWKDSATFATSYGTSQVIALATPTVATTYAVIVTPYVGYGCIDTLYTKVNVPAPISGPSSVCIGGTVTLTNPVPGGVWTSSSSTASIGSSSGVVMGASAGTATITYTIGGTCTSTTTVTVNSCPSLSAPFINQGEALKVFPNPNKGELTLNLSSATNTTATIIITDLVGMKLDELKINTNETVQLRLAYSPGIYILSTNTSQGKLVDGLLLRNSESRLFDIAT